MNALPPCELIVPEFSIAAPGSLPPPCCEASILTLMTPPRGLSVTSLPATIVMTPLAASIVPVLMTRSPTSAVNCASIRPALLTVPVTSVNLFSPAVKSLLEILPAAAYSPPTFSTALGPKIMPARLANITMPLERIEPSSVVGASLLIRFSTREVALGWMNRTDSLEFRLNEE